MLFSKQARQQTIPGILGGSRGGKIVSCEQALKLWNLHI